ncbi:uncharacterized protein TEOVI_000827000 [Trypanosoma equiperdum]|uniref:Uncharacterized protein n=2 Tax=Trypanozoon TaxID=39700 RepID=Q38BI0_TRYB2|nr:hypothetical protein, conserved [Trypanosoma brucei brucei TREU927]EAN77840.1 hypothetical protein, conserved [Trypanosoma brucei brucei TREU927]SCU66474.1 hypothetical protein, conserved [Trypanosoma equiperdum]
MSSKQERIADAMKERVTQLERELRECQQQLQEALQRGDDIQCAKEALQCEAHDIVDQWSRKTAELQTKLNECLCELSEARRLIALSEDRNTGLQNQLQQLEAHHLSQFQELEKYETQNKELSEKLAATERSLCFASQQVGAMEGRVNEMVAEIEQKSEQITSLSRKEDMLAEALLELQKSRKQAETIYNEGRERVSLLDDELSRAKRLLARTRDALLLTEQEVFCRCKIIADEANTMVGALFNQLLSAIHSNESYGEALKEAQHNSASLAEENGLLLLKLQEAEQDLSKLRVEQGQETATCREQIRLLELDVRELQDARINWSRELEAVQNELGRSETNRHTLEESKMSLNAELKIVKDCYSTLLVEHDELKISVQIMRRESEAEISRLVTEKASAMNSYEMKLQEVCMRNTTLNQILKFKEHEMLCHRESNGRQSILVENYHELVGLTQLYISKCEFIHSRMYNQVLDSREKIASLTQTISEKQLENSKLVSIARDLEEKVTSAQNDAKMFRSKVVELSTALNSNREEADNLVSENKWLSDQVFGMREELRDIDVLFNCTLNDMREQGENQQREREMLSEEVNRYEKLLQKSQQKISRCEERCSVFAAEKAAMLKTLTLAEEELLTAKSECSRAREREQFSLKEKGILEKELSQMRRDYVSSTNQVKALMEELRTHDVKQQLMNSSSRTEVEATKTKLNTYIELYENANVQVAQLTKSLQESRDAYDNLHESHQKAKVALEDAKQRCCHDAQEIQKALEERQRIASERDTLVEKYNKVHDVLKLIKKENSGTMAEEVRKLSDLCSQQEAELQELRHQNVILKRGIVKVADETHNPVERGKFVERLNLAEGPLRRPKKRPATDS